MSSSRALRLLLLVGLGLAPARPAYADPASSTVLDSVRFEQRLGAQVPLDLPLRDERGATVRLGDYFGQRPVLLALTYYRCPMLCGLVLSGLLRAVTELSFTAGQQFEIVLVSIDRKDTPELAAAKKQHYTRHYHRKGAEAGWHFLTSPTPAPVAALARAVGFYYSYDPRQDQYAHPSGVITLTPTGQVSRYFYGIDYLPTHLRYGLIEAAAGKIGSPVDQLLLRCYHYDGQTGKYKLAIWRGVQLACVLMALAVAVLLRPRAWRRQP
ncbi:MAG: SCO family protein [Polyangia bacterium]